MQSGYNIPGGGNNIPAGRNNIPAGGDNIPAGGEKIPTAAFRPHRVFTAVFLLIVLFCGNSFAQRTGLGWAWQNPLPQGNPLYSIHFAKDKETGFAVGSDSTILRTDDGGFHWQKLMTISNVR